MIGIVVSRVPVGSLSGLIRPYYPIIAMIIALQIAGAFAQLSTIMMLKPMLDEGVYGDSFETIMNMAAVLFILTLIVAVVMIVATYLSSRVAAQVAESLRLKIMKATLDKTDLDSEGGSPTLTMTCLTSDVASVQRYVFETLSTYLQMPFLLILLLYFVYQLNPVIGIIMTITLIVVMTLTYFFSLRVNRFYKDQISYMDGVNTRLKEKMGGARTIRAYSGYDYEMEKFNEVNNTFGGLNRKITLNSYYIPYLATSFMWGFITLVFMTSVLDPSEEAIVPSELIVFMQYATYIVSTLAIIPYICVGVPRARVCFDRIRAVTSSTGESHEERNIQKDTGDAIIAKDLMIFDRFGRKAINGIDISIPAGTVTTFIGSNGSGMSELSKALLGFSKPESGSLIVNGIDVSVSDSKELRGSLAFAGNSVRLFSGTIRFNLDPHGLHTDEEIMALSSRIGLSEFIEHSKDGLDTVLHSDGSDISGGQRLLIVIGRCLLRETGLYIMEDCFYSLDKETKIKVFDTIMDVCKGKTLVFLMHDASTCSRSDRVVLMDHGVIMDSGSPNELSEDSQLYKELFTYGRGDNPWA